jgi:predicted amidophosphoribosyltransferase
MFLPTRCPLCREVGASPCDRCWQGLAPGPTGAVSALLSYEGDAASLLRSLKYANARSVVGRLADGMALLVEPGWADLVTWAPTSTAHRRRRGYDQAEVLARAVARRLGVPARQVVRRDPLSVAQTGRSRTERLHGPTFVAVRCVSGRVLIVDDVVTTGATLRQAAAVVLATGAREVACIAAAATPPIRLASRFSPSLG